MSNPHPEPHLENLKKIKKGDPAALETQRKGAKRSNEVQAQKRSMREWAVLIGNLPMKDGKLTDPKTAAQLAKESPDKPNVTMEGAVIIAMYNKALKGDTKAAMFLAKLKEQMAEEVSIKVDPLSDLSSEELIKLYESTKAKRT